MGEGTTTIYFKQGVKYYEFDKGFRTSEQRSTFFNCLLDMAGVNHTGGNNHPPSQPGDSRANSLEPPPGTSADIRGERREPRDEDDGALGALAAAEQRRQRSIRFVKNRSSPFTLTVRSNFDKEKMFFHF